MQSSRTSGGLFAQRSLRTLTDVCLGCHASGHVVTLTGDSICAACNVNIAQNPVKLQACFAATSREAHARAGQACAFVLILGARTFFVGVQAPHFLAMDSHLRTFRGNVKDDTSICIKGGFGLGHNLDASLGEVWRRLRFGLGVTWALARPSHRR